MALASSTPFGVLRNRIVAGYRGIRRVPRSTTTGDYQIRHLPSRNVLVFWR